MTDQELAEVLALGHELRGIEFKGPGPTSNAQLFARVVKAMLGMANRRDGGRVIVGVADNQGVLNPIGLADADVATWKYDDISGKLAEYADPSIEFEVQVPQHEGNKYIALHVREFEAIPILCKNDYPRVLRKGACYVRSRRKPETTEIPTQEDMRDLLELATEKGVRKWVTQAQRAGLIPLGAPPPPTDAELFDQQLGDLQ